ncbi:hypothetical protein V6N13_073281 [Hibiscus sabdariffa]
METVCFSSATTPTNNSNIVQDAFDWITPVEHRAPIGINIAAVDIPKASTTSKRKAEHSATLDLSTSIDTVELEELTPTRIQPLRSAKKHKTHPQRKVIISTESDDESSESLVF